MKEAIKTRIIYLLLGIFLIACPYNGKAQIDSLLQNPLEIENRQQGFDEENLSIYANDSDFDYDEAKYEENTLQGLIRRFKLWLLNSLGKGLNADLTKYLLIAGGALFITWFLLKSEKYNFIKKKDKKATRYVEELDIRVHQNILQQKYDEAKEQGAYREALRYAYLMTLKSMDTNNIIQWKEWKLGSDYQEELKNTSYTTDFNQLTQFFNFGWYGKRPLNADMFSEIENTYTGLNTKIKQG